MIGDAAGRRGATTDRPAPRPDPTGTPNDWITPLPARLAWVDVGDCGGASATR